MQTANSGGKTKMPSVISKMKTIKHMKPMEPLEKDVLKELIALDRGTFLVNIKSPLKGLEENIKELPKYKARFLASRSLGKIQKIAGLIFKDTKKYTVKEKDTLWGVAKSKYGDPTLWPAIFLRNSKIKNQDIIMPKQKLDIPAKKDAKRFCQTLYKGGFPVEKFSKLIEINIFNNVKLVELLEAY